MSSKPGKIINLTCPENSGIVKVVRLLEQLTSQPFYGKIEIAIRAGKIETIRKEQTIQINSI